MDSQNALNILTTLISKKESELDALKVAAGLLTDGYESDTERITTEVETRTTATIAEKDSTIEELQAQLDALQTPESEEAA